jgi:hypothetical protein
LANEKIEKGCFSVGFRTRWTLGFKGESSFRCPKFINELNAMEMSINKLVKALTALRIGLTCTPEITRIYSLTTNSAIVPAGIKEKVKIEGKNFLNGGKVFILSADDGGNTYLSLDKYDINKWFLVLVI